MWLMASTTPRPLRIFLSTTSLFTNGATRRMVRWEATANLRCADAVCAQCREMAKRQTSDLRRSLFVHERRRKIFHCKLAIPGQNRPQEGANGLAKRKQHAASGSVPDQSDRAQGKPVNQAIQHAARSTLL